MSHGMHPDRCDSCGGYHFNGEPGLCDQCTAGRRRIAVAALPLAGERGVLVVDVLQRLSIDAKQVAKDIESARIEGAERALLERDVRDVERHAEQLTRKADVWREHERRATGPLANGCAARVEEFAGQAADCQAWLARAKAVLG